MNKDFFKKNWIYIVLFCLILALNILPRFKEKEAPEDKAKVEEKAEVKKEPESLFVDFEEAQERSKKIEKALTKTTPLYLFYISSNLFIVFIFFLGLVINGYFVLSKIRKEKVLQKTCRANPPPWNMGDVFKILILAMGLSYAFFIMFGFFMSILQALLGAQFDLLKGENFRMIFDTIVLDFAVLGVIMWFLYNVYHRQVSDMGFTGKNIGRNILYGISGYVAIIPIILILGILIYILLNFLKIKPPPQPIVGLFLAEENTVLIFASSIIASVFGPAIEELFFRGVMYNAVKKKLGIFRAILITSVLFSFLHTHAMTYFLVGFIPITILGIVLAYLYEKTGSLIPSITLHVLNNVGSVIMVFLFKYFNQLVT